MNRNGPGFVKRLTALGPWRLGVWVVGVVSWSYLLVITDFELLAISVWSVPFLLVIAVVSTPWRAVSWSLLVSLFLVGMGPILVVVVFIQRLIELTPLEEWVRGLFETLADAGVTTSIAFPSTVVFAPILEEFFKVAPLLALLLWRRSRVRALAGPVDYAVMAGATGAGFGFGEDILVYLNQGNLFGPPSSVYALNLGPAYSSVAGVIPAPFESDYTNVMSFFYAEMQYLTGVVWSGHGALAMGLGCAIGLAVWGARRIGNRLLYLVVPGVYLWVVWEHMMANWYGGAGCAQKDVLMCTLASVDLQGRIFPIVVLMGWGIAIYMCSSAVRYYRSQDRYLGTNDFGRDGYRTDGWRGVARYTRDWFAVRRWRRKASYGVEHLIKGRHVSEGDATAMVAARLRGLGLWSRLNGQVVDSDRELDQVLERAVPLD
jgi:hypothetical protein